MRGTKAALLPSNGTDLHEVLDLYGSNWDSKPGRGLKDQRGFSGALGPGTQEGHGRGAHHHAVDGDQLRGKSSEACTRNPAQPSQWLHHAYEVADAHDRTRQVVGHVEDLWAGRAACVVSVQTPWLLVSCKDVSPPQAAPLPRSPHPAGAFHAVGAALECRNMAFDSLTPRHSNFLPTTSTVLSETAPLQ